MDDALTAPEEGFSRRYTSASEILVRMVASGQANYLDERAQRIDTLGNLDWEAIHTSEKAIVGTPDVVIDKIKEIRDALHRNGPRIQRRRTSRRKQDQPIPGTVLRACGAGIQVMDVPSAKGSLQTVLLRSE